MLNLASRSSQAWRSIQNLAKGMASVAERIGDTKVPMSLLETGAYINYQRIEDNLAIIRGRYAPSFEPVTLLLTAYQAQPPSHPLGEDCLRPPR